jgi:hypothetical protein
MFELDALIVAPPRAHGSPIWSCRVLVQVSRRLFQARCARNSAAMSGSSRDFVPWRFSDAGRPSASRASSLPASEIFYEVRFPLALQTTVKAARTRFWRLFMLRSGPGISRVPMGVFKNTNPTK